MCVLLFCTTVRSGLFPPVCLFLYYFIPYVTSPPPLSSSSSFVVSVVVFVGTAPHICV